jgi:endonuclease/exonuclease/phosphatase family metal-dependent hydrolase
MKKQDQIRRLRVVAWNIEKGKRWHDLIACLESDDLAAADILCLNEVDEGMARSGNRRIAQELAKGLKMRVAFGPAYRELTKGTGEERFVSGENAIGLQGNAILSRFPIVETRNVHLPVCHDPSKSEERREGGRCCLIARLDTGNGVTLTVAVTHLEVLTTPACRSRQMRFLLQEIRESPAIVAGDFNTNTFTRGTSWRTFRSALRLVSPEVKSEVLRPVPYEPLFAELQQAGFEWDGFNDDLPTCHADLRGLEDQKYLPRAFRRYILDRITELPLRLDWIAVRGAKSVGGARTLTNLCAQPSDHLPITCEIRI